MIQSSLNYTGGKFKLLPQILPLLPKNVDCNEKIFVDRDGYEFYGCESSVELGAYNRDAYSK